MQIIQSNMLLNCKQFWCHSFVVHSKSIFSYWVFIFCSSTYTWSWQSYQWALFLNCCLFFFSLTRQLLRSLSVLVAVAQRSSKSFLFEFHFPRVVPLDLAILLGFYLELVDNAWGSEGITLELKWRISVKNVICTLYLFPFPIFKRSNCFKDYKYFLVQVTFSIQNNS